MSILIDTTIWSLALRRRLRNLNEDQRRQCSEWERLVATGQAMLIGPIRQEILSGIREPNVFREVRTHLNAFRQAIIRSSDYDDAAEMYNAARRRGITGTPIDLLICAVAARLGSPIFTTDADFSRYAQCLPIRLHTFS